MINLMIIYDMVNIFFMKNYKSSRKLRVGLNWYPGVNWSTTTTIKPNISKETLFPPQCYRAGIIYPVDLCNREGNMITLEEVRKNYPVNLHFLDYYRLQSDIEKLKKKHWVLIVKICAKLNTRKTHMACNSIINT